MWGEICCLAKKVLNFQEALLHGVTVREIVISTERNVTDSDIYICVCVCVCNNFLSFIFRVFDAKNVD